MVFSGGNARKAILTTRTQHPSVTNINILQMFLFLKVNITIIFSKGNN